MTYYQKIKRSPRQLQNAFLNGILHLHDLHCDCLEPFKHAVDTIFTEVKPTNFKEETKKKIKQCLGIIGTDPTGDAAVEEDIGEGVLEALFSENQEDEG